MVGKGGEIIKHRRVGQGGNIRQPGFTGGAFAGAQQGGFTSGGESGLQITD